MQTVCKQDSSNVFGRPNKNSLSASAEIHHPPAHGRWRTQILFSAIIIQYFIHWTMFVCSLLCACLDQGGMPLFFPTCIYLRLLMLIFNLWSTVVDLPALSVWCSLWFFPPLLLLFSDHKLTSSPFINLIWGSARNNGCLPADRNEQHGSLESGLKGRIVFC